MKKSAILVLLSFSLAIAHAQGSSSLAGKWKVHSSIVGNESNMECLFTQNETELGGTCSSDQGNLKITGKIDGKKVSWSYNSEYNGSPLTLRYTGTLEAGKVTGTVLVEQFGVEGDFTATLTSAN